MFRAASTTAARLMFGACAVSKAGTGQHGQKLYMSHAIRSALPSDLALSPVVSRGALSAGGTAQKQQEQWQWQRQRLTGGFRRAPAPSFTVVSHARALGHTLDSRVLLTTHALPVPLCAGLQVQDI